MSKGAKKLTKCALAYAQASAFGIQIVFDNAHFLSVKRISVSNFMLNYFSEIFNHEKTRIGTRIYWFVFVLIRVFSWFDFLSIKF